MKKQNRVRTKSANLNIKLKQHDMDFLREYAAIHSQTMTSLIEEYIDVLRYHRTEEMGIPTSFDVKHQDQTDVSVTRRKLEQLKYLNYVKSSEVDDHKLQDKS